jgi:hypothetical protein
MTKDEMEHFVDAMQQTLEGLGYDVQGASSLTEGTAEFELVAPDLPLTLVTVKVTLPGGGNDIYKQRH